VGWQWLCACRASGVSGMCGHAGLLKERVTTRSSCVVNLYIIDEVLLCNDHSTRQLLLLESSTSVFCLLFTFAHRTHCSHLLLKSVVYGCCRVGGTCPFTCTCCPSP
jgi:hypothetical protein